MAILSGCDYLPGIEKMGLKTAHRLLRKHKKVDRVVRAVQFDGKMKVPPGYLEAFHQAENTFLYQWVYCPERKSLVHLTEPEEGVDVNTMEYIGKTVEPHIATKVAQGYLHPHSKQPLAVPLGSSFGSRTPLRRAATQVTPDLKSHQSIESFFRPRRTPLAELDPNSFTPSPSQQRLLDQPPVTWSAEPIGERPAMARALTDVTRAHTQPLRRAVSDRWHSSSATSPKRQRLCSDNSISIAMKRSTGLTGTSSRFFTTPDSAASPSIRGKKGKEAEDQGINIWSDDSLEEALSQLPEVETEGVKAKRSGKLSIFEDQKCTTAVERPRDATLEDSQTTIGTVSTQNETASQDSCVTPDTSFESSNTTDVNDTQESVFSKGLSAEMAALRAKFTFGAEIANDKTTNLAGLSNEVYDTVPCSSPPLPATMLDREVADEDATIDQAEWLAMESQPLRPLSVSKKPGLSAREIVPKGSEDLLVPDSEGDDESTRRSSFGDKLELSKFAFTG